MKVSTLFVLGLAVGGVVVFGIRAASLDGEAQAPTEGPPPKASPEAADPHAGHASTDSREATAPVAAGPDVAPENTICPVMGNPVDPDVFVDYEGRRIGFCCPGCDALFLAEPAKFLKKVDAELAEREAGDAGSAHGDARLDPDAPTSADKEPENEICPVMGNPVDPEVFVDYEGRRIGFCCPGCDALFLESPEKYLKKVDTELEQRDAK